MTELLPPLIRATADLSAACVECLSARGEGMSIKERILSAIESCQEAINLYDAE